MLTMQIHQVKNMAFPLLEKFDAYSRQSVTYNLGQYKMEQLSPISPSIDEGVKEQETLHFDIIEIGGGVVQMFHLFCPRV